MEEIIGSIEKGKKADFIVMDRSPFEVEQLPDLKPESVWINGEKV